MPAVTALLKALPTLTRLVSGGAAPPGSAAALGTDPVALTDAQLDQVTGGGDPKGGVIVDLKGSPVLNILGGQKGAGGGADF